MAAGAKAFPNVEQQGPVRFAGKAGQNAFLALETVHFVGATGLIGSAYGIPGVTLTRTSTGAYTISYPPINQAQGRVAIIPGLEVPTGQAYDVSLTQHYPGSGTTQINITRMGNAIASGAVPVSGTVQPMNPATGTVLSLLFVVNPVTKF